MFTLMPHMSHSTTPAAHTPLSQRLLAALSFPHAVDRYLEALDPRWSLAEVRATVTEVTRQTADSVTLTLAPNRRWAGFRPGQFVQLTADVNGVRRTRCFSPASSAHAAGAVLELTLKAQPRAGLTAYLQQNASVGMTVTLSQAQGSFHLPDARPSQLLLISGGSGITPMMAMLRTLIDEGHRGRIDFLHYAPSRERMLYADALDMLAARHPNLRVIRVFTRTDDASGCDAQGTFSPDQIGRLISDHLAAQTYLCGPNSLMSAVEAHWRAHDADARLHQERYTLAPPVTAAAPNAVSAAVAGDLRFARSERYAANDGRSLLEQAEAAGLNPPSGCRMGICATCTCRKTAGTVRNLLTGEVSSEADEDIRLCVSAAVGDVTLDL